MPREITEKGYKIIGDIHRYINEVKETVDNVKRQDEKKLKEKDAEIKLLKKSLSNNNQGDKELEIIKLKEKIREITAENDATYNSFIKVQKGILSIKSLYPLIEAAVKNKYFYKAEELIDILTKEELDDANEEALAGIINFLKIYSENVDPDFTAKEEFLARNIQKFNLEKSVIIKEKIFDGLLNNIEVFRRLEEEFAMDFIKYETFSGNKDNAKYLINMMSNTDNYDIRTKVNKEYLLLCGVYLGMTGIEDNKIVSTLYKKITPISEDFRFINFLMSKNYINGIEFDRSENTFEVFSNDTIDEIYRKVIK